MDTGRLRQCPACRTGGHGVARITDGKVVGDSGAVLGAMVVEAIALLAEVRIVSMHRTVVQGRSKIIVKKMLLRRRHHAVQDMRRCAIVEFGTVM